MDYCWAFFFILGKQNKTNMKNSHHLLVSLYLIAILLAVCSFAFPSCTNGSTTAEQQAPPNIIVILADDMGYGDIQAYNPDSKIPTPNLNQLVKEGMQFLDAHTGSAVCTPTRYGLVTGQYAWRTRLKKGVLSGYSSHLIDPDRATIADVLKSQGYYTGVIGKWHLGIDYPWVAGTPPQEANDFGQFLPEPGDIDYSQAFKNSPNDIGFDYSYILPGSLDMSPYIYIQNDRATAIPDSISPFIPFPAYQRKGEIAPDFGHQDALDHFTIKAKEFITNRSKEKEPFFLYFPLTGPHKPALPAQRFEGKSGLGPYGDLVMQVDWTVGEVLNTLKEQGIADHTLVIYTSDNGSYMFRTPTDEPDHTMQEETQGFHVANHQANYIWRGTKADIFEAGHRVPFIVRWPGHVEAGATAKPTICLTDILATTADIVGATVPANAAEDSYSFLPLLLQQETYQRLPVVHHAINGTFALRKDQWKMVFSDGSGGREQPVGKVFEKPYQLFDLEKDPSETNNLIEVYPEIAAAMSSLLEEIKRED